MHRSVTRQTSFDLSKLLVTEDWFSDINPQTMRRLLNIVSVTGKLYRPDCFLCAFYHRNPYMCRSWYTKLCVFYTGRLLRANQITFNWDRLASWINLTEQWPYRTSWLILYLEETDGIPEQATLKTIYERFSFDYCSIKFSLMLSEFFDCHMPSTQEWRPSSRFTIKA